MSKEKPIVVYLHRYPPEIEAFQWPALPALADALAPDFELVYACMGLADEKRDEALRSKMRVLEQPFTVDQTNGRDKWFKTVRWYWGMGGLLKKIRALNPALIICKETLPFIPGCVAKTGIPTIIETSDWWWSILLGHRKWGRQLADWMEAREVRSWNRHSVKATVSTRAEGQLLVAKGLDPSRVAVINAPQNPGVFCPLSPRPTKTELGLDENLKYFAIFGIIRGGKGYDQLLDWWTPVMKKHPDWRLVIIGGAGGETWCRKEIAKRGLESAVHMTGWLPTKQDVNRWLNAMDAVLAHRRNSPDNQGIIPSALYNGLSTGRPVVATGLPGMAEIVRDGIDGFLFTPDDEDSFIHALERAVDDPTAAAKIGLAGAARAAECFNPQTAAQAHCALIDSML
ncbi:MAG: glycosyltransferase family 4 protein [Actinomycetaceae bacterium]|nr:glycosyltransferase family 4 protein [Actinomycetaceae bacterium]